MAMTGKDFLQKLLPILYLQVSIYAIFIDFNPGIYSAYKHDLEGQEIRVVIPWDGNKAYLFFFVLGLELRAFTLSHSASPFCDGYFQDRVLQTICLG
jgi:hypothetical protein